MRVKLAEWYGWTLAEIDALSYADVQHLLAVRGAIARIEGEHRKGRGA